MKYALIVVIVYAILVIAINPSEKDVQKCMETTNYNHDRCVVELMR